MGDLGKKCISFFLVVVLCAQALSFGQTAPALVALSQPLQPLCLSGIRIHADNPLKVDFIVDPADQSDLKGQALKREVEKNLKFFLAGLTVPASDLWVNLSPYEKDRIIAEGFGRTEVGRQFLELDFLLKELAASLTFPQGEVGRKFWDEVNRRTKGKIDEIPMHSVNKVWIVSEVAKVYERATQSGDIAAFIVHSHLKVMLESDYRALSHAKVGERSPGKTGDDSDLRAVMKDVVIPVLEKEINEGKHFASLRQIYHALVLAGWFKNKIKNVAGSQSTLLSNAYVDQNKTIGIDHGDKSLALRVFENYVQVFNRGIYNYITEEHDETTGDIIPRRYFSGGFDFAMTASAEKFEILPQHQPKELFVVSMIGRLFGRKISLPAETVPPKFVNPVINQLVFDGSKNRARIFTTFPADKLSRMEPDRRQEYSQGGVKVSEPWQIEQSGLSEVEDALKFRLSESIIRRAVSAKKQEKTITVIDWGCGNGRALKELAKLLKSRGINNVRLVGFADQYHPDWRSAPAEITFLWDRLQNLPLYLKELDEVDVIYSSFGLFHLSVRLYNEHMNALFPFLAQNSVVVHNSQYREGREKTILDEWRQRGAVVKRNKLRENFVMLVSRRHQNMDDFNNFLRSGRRLPNLRALARHIFFSSNTLWQTKQRKDTSRDVEVDDVSAISSRHMKLYIEQNMYDHNGGLKTVKFARLLHLLYGDSGPLLTQEQYDQKLAALMLETRDFMFGDMYERMLYDQYELPLVEDTTLITELRQFTKERELAEYNHRETEAFEGDFAAWEQFREAISRNDFEFALEVIPNRLNEDEKLALVLEAFWQSFDARKSNLKLVLRALGDNPDELSVAYNQFIKTFNPEVIRRVAPHLEERFTVLGQKIWFHLIDGIEAIDYAELSAADSQEIRGGIDLEDLKAELKNEQPLRNLRFTEEQMRQLAAGIEGIGPEILNIVPLEEAETFFEITNQPATSH